ncbi:MAG: cob(I)yrinic acid a,c-diamide adenosyltransferase, partial [Eubacterium sp.]|nr:cob(I)yrinic acid a,c-diamide adenosyltransferase [Eubacterium sp.]
MDNKISHAFYGRGKGKTSAALGQALRDVKEGERVTIIQFLKGRAGDDFEFLKRLEPEVQVFRFDKNAVCYRELSIEEKEEEKQNILNGIHYAHKVIETGESNIIVLDELLGVLDLGILNAEQVIELLTMEGDYRKL